MPFNVRAHIKHYWRKKLYRKEVHTISNQMSQYLGGVGEQKNLTSRKNRLKTVLPIKLGYLRQYYRDGLKME